VPGMVGELACGFGPVMPAVRQLHRTSPGAITSWYCIDAMKHTKRNLIILSLILIAALATGLWVAVSGWPPIIIRDRHYSGLIRDFRRATLRDSIRPGDTNAGWGFEVQIHEWQTTARVNAVAHMGVARVKYGDEENEHILYKYVDYKSPKRDQNFGKCPICLLDRKLDGNKPLDTCIRLG